MKHWGLEWKSRESRDTWSNRHVWPWSTKWSRAKANRVLLRNTHHSKHPLPITLEKTLHMDITRWSISKSDWLYSLQLKMRISIESAKTKPGADCSSDHELLIAKFRLKLKKIGKTTRQLSHELSQIPYTVSVTNRFQGSDLIECVRRTMDRGSKLCIGGGDKNHPQEGEMQKGKTVVWEALIYSWVKERSESSKEKRKHIPIWMQSSKE